MNLLKFLKVISDKLLYVIIIPLVVGAVVFLATKDLPLNYSTFSTVYSGVTSNTGLIVDVVKVDNVATQNEYNNLMSMLTSSSFYEDISLHLLTQHLLLTKPDKEIISEAAFNELKLNVPPKVRKLVVKGNYDATLQNLKNYIVQDDKNYIYRLMNYGAKYYSVQAISTLKSERLTGSDLIKITYECDDPGICYNTVKYATQQFIANYSEFKLSQSNSAIAYFEAKLDEIRKKLDASEQKLLNFNIDNVIINYYEQTEQITTQQEKIEIRLQEVKMEYEASNAVLAKLEAEVEKRYDINLRNTEVLRLREQLLYYNKAITAIELHDNSPDKPKLNDFINKRRKLEIRLQDKVDSLNVFDNKSQGIEAQKLLSEWLEAVKNNENYMALYKSMQERLIEFMKQFKRYAPLGAEMKRMEREINVYEREYLSVLHDLGVARQNEKNISMRSNMKIYDQAKFPINAIPPKTKLYVVIGALFSLIFYLLVVFLIELFDSRIKSPSQLKKLIEKDVIAAYSAPSKKNIAREYIETRATKMIFQKVREISFGKDRPVVLQFISNWHDIDAREYALLLANELRKYNFTATILDFKSNASDSVLPDSDSQVLRKDNYDMYDSYNALLQSENINTDFVLCLYPEINAGIASPALLSEGLITIWVFDANSLWTNADKYLLDKVNQIVRNNDFAILINAEPDNLEEMYGEVPKKRSFIRKFIKNMLRKIV